MIQKMRKFQEMLANILGVMVLILMFIIVIEVVGRFFFNTPFKGGVEISQIVIVWLLFLPLAYALICGHHVRVTLIVMHLPPRLNLIVEIVGKIISLLFLGLATYAGWTLFWASFSVGEVMPAPIWLPFWLAKLAVPLGFLLFFTQLFMETLGDVSTLRRWPNGS